MAELMKYNAACRALAEARDVDEVKDMRDKAIAIQTYAKQAKNRQLETDATEIRIRAERRLGEMLAETPKATGGEHGGRVRIDGARKVPSNPTSTLADIGITKKLSARSQKLAAISAKEFESKLAVWKERVESEEDKVRIDLLAPKAAHVANNSGENEWYTPPEYIEAARVVLGDIDCDPASSPVANETVKAKAFFTAQDDGLSQEWGRRVWMNPPYAQPLISQFCEALADRLESGEVELAVVLVNNATDTVWFHRILALAAAACFVKRRIHFLDPQGNPSGAPLQGQAVLFFGSKITAFAKAFTQFGVVLRHVEV